MSRIGKQPVPIPSGVKVSQSAQEGATKVLVEGPKGKLALQLRPEVSVSIEGNLVKVKRQGDGAFDKAYHGTARALIANMLKGVSAGFEKRLEIEGVGYGAKIEDKKLVLQIGFSHPVPMEIPAGLTLEIPKPTIIVVKGVDRQLVGEFAAMVRRVRPPEPYKGKGIQYSGEKIIRKVGKAFGSAE